MQYSSPARRALIAVGAVIGFYVLAITVMILLLLVPSALALFLFIKIGPSGSIACWPLLLGYAFLMGWFCMPAAIGIGVSLVPRLYPSSPPGPRLAGTEQPALFALLTETARAVGQAGPAEVFLVAGLTGWVKEWGGVMGVGRRRVLGLGLPLQQILSISELRAVLAHQFGHYCSVDFRLNPFIRETHEAIGLTLPSIDWQSRLNRTLKIGLLIYAPLESVLSAYSRWFSKITQAISDEQEYSADALAARAFGAEPLIRGLRKIHSAMPAWWAFEHEVGLVGEAGYRPRLAEGFARFIQAPNVASMMVRALEKEIKTGRAFIYDYDTRTPLRDRLPRLESFTNGDPMVDDALAITLLQDLPDLEKRLLPYVVFTPGKRELPIVEWDEVGDVLYLPSYAKMLEEHAKVLKGITPSTLPEAAATTRFIDYLAGRAGIDKDEVSDEDAIDEVPKFRNEIVGAALVNLLIQRGWSIQFALGMPVTLRLGQDSIEPFTIVPRLLDHSLTAEDWREECQALGIAEIDLGSIPVVIGKETKQD